jgi:hypothetical protein
VRSIALALWLLAAPAVFAQEDRSARQVLDECVESVEADVLGMPALEEECPGLEQALVDLGLEPFIADSQWETIGAYGLMSLQSVEQRYREPPPATKAMQVDSLESVLDELRQPVQAEQPLTWFERFKRWLRNLMSSKDSGDDSWLTRWLDEYRLSETARNIIFYGSVVLVVLLAVAVIVNEVRVARKGRRKKDRTGAADAAGVFGEALTVRSLDLDAASRSERPSILLQMLVATLVKSGRLQAERSLTHRELTARAKFDDSSQRESFRRVAQLAERIVYGGDDAPADLDEVVQAGRALHSTLSGAVS